MLVRGSPEGPITTWPRRLREEMPKAAHGVELLHSWPGPQDLDGEHGAHASRVCDPEIIGYVGCLCTRNNHLTE